MEDKNGKNGGYQACQRIPGIYPKCKNCTKKRTTTGANGRTRVISIKCVKCQTHTRKVKADRNRQSAARSKQKKARKMRNLRAENTRLAGVLAEATLEAERECEEWDKNILSLIDLENQLAEAKAEMAATVAKHNAGI